MRTGTLLLWAGLAILASGCSRSRNDELKLGYFPNVTHGQAIVGSRDGTFQRELGATRFHAQIFNAGPAAMEALLSGSIDAAYVGPGPAINAFVRSDGQLRVIATASNGGAALISRTATTSSELKGKKVAVPQTGNTQDIALRRWLAMNELQVGRDVNVVAVPNPEIVNLFRRNEIEAAWVPEPWAARLLAEGGKLMVDERSLWPEGRFHTTVLVTRSNALVQKRPAIEALVRAHVELTRRWKADPAGFASATNEGFRQLTGEPLPEPILKDAFSRLEPALEPELPLLNAQAQHARDVGYLQEFKLDGIVDRSLLQKSLGAPDAAPTRQAQ